MRRSTRTRAGHAQALAFEVSHTLDLRVLVRHELDLARRVGQLNDRLDVLALGLQIDAVVVEADHALHGTGQHFVFGVDASAFVQQFDVKPFFLEVA